MIIDVPNTSSRIRSAFASRLQHGDGLDELLGLIRDDPEWNDVRHIAYLLATVFHETAFTFKPITEYGNRRYFDKYESTTKIGQRLGNKYPNDGYKFRGRGYVMITGRRNMQVFSEELNVDLIADPDQALKPEVSYRIATVGMRKGLFTGKALAHYLNGEKKDYVNARRIINGVDRAEQIAKYAETFEEILTTKDKEKAA